MKKCELLGSCGFFLKFKGNSEVGEAGVGSNTSVKVRKKSENCERKIISKKRTDNRRWITWHPLAKCYKLESVFKI